MKPLKKYFMHHRDGRTIPLLWRGGRRNRTAVCCSSTNGVTLYGTLTHSKHAKPFQGWLRRICTIYTFIQQSRDYILGALMLCATAAGGAGSVQDAIVAPATVRIYSVKPIEISGISQLKQEPSISDIRVIDLSVIPEMEAMFGAYVNNEMNDSSIAEIKALSKRLPRIQLQALADAQMNLFDLQARYDIEIDDLPVVVFEQNKTLSLYQGSDVYQGFLRWQQSKR